MGCGGMSPSLLLLLSLASCSLLQGTLLRPRHVRLEAENFHVRLRWEPDPSSPSYATYERRTGSYKPVDRVLLKLWYWLQLYEGNLLVQQVPCKRSSEEVPCTFEHLKPSTQYCVRTAAADLARERSREAEQCLVTPAGPAGFPWVLAVLSAFFLLLLSVAGLCFVQLRVLPSPPETRLPKALALRSSQPSVAVQVPPLQPEEDPVALLLQTVLPSCGPSTAGQASASLPPSLPGPAQYVSGYRANGFGPECPEVRDPSWLRDSQLGHALGSQVPLQLEQDGEAGNGDDLPEQLVRVEPAGNRNTSDGDSQIPEIRLPLHLQLYSKCQCPVLGAGGHLPLPLPSGSCSRQYLQGGLGRAGRWVRLSSVKLSVQEEEEVGQLPGAPRALPAAGAEPGLGDSAVQLRGCSERVEACVPSPCQPPPSPRGAGAFSGYEPRGLSGSEHSQWGAPAASSSQQSPGRIQELPDAGCRSRAAAARMGMGQAPTGRERHVPGTKDGQDPEISSGGLVLLRQGMRSTDQS